VRGSARLSPRPERMSILGLHWPHFPRIRSMLYAIPSREALAVGTSGAASIRIAQNSFSHCTCITWSRTLQQWSRISHSRLAGASPFRLGTKTSGMTRRFCPCSMRPNNSFKPKPLRGSA
jgi:hypothetical protein